MYVDQILSLFVNSTASGSGNAEDHLHGPNQVDEDQLDALLKTLKRSTARITVLLMRETAAANFLRAAKRRSMTGKGWTYLGGAWVGEALWSYDTPDKDLAEAVKGLVGVVPADEGHIDEQVTIVASPEGPTFILPLNSTPAPNVDECPEMTACPCVRKPDVYLPFVEDALDSVARAAVTWVEQRPPGPCRSTVKGKDALCPAQLTSIMRSGIGPDPQEGNWKLARPTFTDKGERERVPLQVRNVLHAGTDGAVVAAVWETASGVTVDTQGSWKWLRSIVWPSGTTAVPTDRVEISEHKTALVLVVVLIGVTLSIVVGHFLHRLQVHWLPESGATIILGVLFGLGLLWTGDEEISQNAGFDERLFSLVFLPVIIFESGFALDKHPFFSQLGSILCMAIFGTLISVFIVGGILAQVGGLGWILRLSFEVRKEDRVGG